MIIKEAYASGQVCINGKLHCEYESSTSRIAQTRCLTLTQEHVGIAGRHLSLIGRAIVRGIVADIGSRTIWITGDGAETTILSGFQVWRWSSKCGNWVMQCRKRDSPQ